MCSGSVSMLQIDSHRTSSRGFRRSRLQWQSQSPSQQWCMLLVAENKYYFFRNIAAPVFLAGSHHLNNGVCFWWLRVSITSFRTSFALPLQYFESAVPTDRRAYSSDIDCFGDDWQSFLKQCLHWRPVLRLGGCDLIFSSINRLGSWMVSYNIIRTTDFTQTLAPVL